MQKANSRMGMLRTPTGATKAVARAFNNLALEARKHAGMALDSVTDRSLAQNAQAESVRPNRDAGAAGSRVRNIALAPCPRADE
jgi:hypothetical protein